MMEVSMITMNCASAMRPSAAQRRGFADCMGVPFRAADRGSTMKTEGRKRPSAQGCRAAVAHRRRLGCGGRLMKRIYLWGVSRIVGLSALRLDREISLGGFGSHLRRGRLRCGQDDAGGAGDVGGD